MHLPHNAVLHEDVRSCLPGSNCCSQCIFHTMLLHEDVHSCLSQCIFHTMRSFMRMFIHVYQEAMLLGISMYLPHNAVLHEDVRSCLPGSDAARNLNVSSTQCGPSWGCSSRLSSESHVYTMGPSWAMLLRNLNVSSTQCRGCPSWGCSSMYLPHNAVLHERWGCFMRMFVHVYQEVMLLGISMYLPHNAVLHEDVRSCLPGSDAARNLNVSSTQCGPSRGCSSRLRNLNVSSTQCSPSWGCSSRLRNLNVSSTQCGPSWGCSSRLRNLNASSTQCGPSRGCSFMSTRKWFCSEAQCIFHTMRSFMRMSVMSTRKRCCSESQCIFHTMRSFMRMFVHVYQEAMLLGISMYLPHNAVLHEDVRLDWGISMHLPHDAVLHEDVRSCLPGSYSARNLNVSSTQCGPSWGCSFMSTRKRCCSESQCIFYTMRSFMRMFVHVYQEAMLLGISMFLPHNVVLHEDVRLDWGISMYLPHNAVLHEDVRSCLPGSDAARNLNVSSTQCGPSRGCLSRLRNLNVSSTQCGPSWGCSFCLPDAEESQCIFHTMRSFMRMLV